MWHWLDSHFNIFQILNLKSKKKKKTLYFIHIYIHINLSTKQNDINSSFPKSDKAERKIRQLIETCCDVVPNSLHVSNEECKNMTNIFLTLSFSLSSRSFSRSIRRFLTFSSSICKYEKQKLMNYAFKFDVLNRIKQKQSVYFSWHLALIAMIVRHLGSIQNPTPLFFSFIINPILARKGFGLVLVKIQGGRIPKKADISYHLLPWYQVNPIVAQLVPIFTCQHLLDGST